MRPRLLMVLVLFPGLLAAQDAALCLRLAREAEVRGEQATCRVHLDSAVAIARRTGDTALWAEALILQGTICHGRNDFHDALTRYYEALRLREAMGDELGLSECYNHIGTVLHYLSDHERAAEHYRTGLGLALKHGSKRAIGRFHNNLGVLASDRGRYSEAMEHYGRGLATWSELADTSWQAVTLTNLGECYLRLGRADSARALLIRSMQLMGPRLNPAIAGHAFVIMGKTHIGQGPRSEALRWCERALRMSRSNGDGALEKEARECLYQTYAALGNSREELHHYRRYVQLSDSLFGNHRAMELARLEITLRMRQQQRADSLARETERLRVERAHAEGMAREREQRNIFLFGSIGVLVVALGLWNRLRFIRRSRAELQHQRDRADALLHNILPVPVADELLANGRVEAREFPGATILFTDFEDFTRTAEQLPAPQLVAVIDECFRAFDAILARHGVEKIKTVGDAYLACGGVPGPDRGRAIDVVLAALEMQAFMHRFEERRRTTGSPAFAMRIGIHTGTVVGGVVGSHKFAFDIWGDAVNTAARMESSGEVRRVNISATTWALVKDDPRLRITGRGMVETKGKGPMPMYFVERARTTPMSVVPEAA